jgi:hypothetical protein
MVLRAANGVVALVLVVLVLPSAFGGRASPVAPTPARAKVVRQSRDHADARRRIGMQPNAHSGSETACPMQLSSTAYVNPLRAAKVKAERIDQGVDYAGSGQLAAIGVARIVYLGTENTGWPGAFIEYRLLAGPDAGCYVYYAEGVTPQSGLRVGDTVAAGQPIATIIQGFPTGIELGWAAGRGTKSYAALTSHWTVSDDEDNHATGPGQTFSRLIAALGGPPGKIEG